jgi:capsular polysaccharide biosynthesis protein
VEQYARDDRSADYPDLARIAATAARWWWLLILGAVVGVGIALLAGDSGTPMYKASTRVLVGANGGDYAVLRAAGQQAETDVTLATSEPVLAAVRRRVGSAVTMSQLRSGVSADADSATRVLTITARTDSPVTAAVVANAVASELDVQTRAGGGGPSSELEVIDRARAPAGAEEISPRTLILIAGLAGVLAALTLVVVLDLSRRLIATEDELAATVPAPFLGTVGRRRARLVGAATLLAEQREQVVVAGVHDDGAGAQSAFALATALAAGGSQVALVDADTEAASGSLTGWLGLEGRPGFTEGLAGTREGSDPPSLDALVVRLGPLLELLPRGRGELAYRADPERVEHLVRRLGRRVDIVVVCAPFAAGPSGAVSWAQLADGVVLALRRHRASRDELRRTVDVLERSGARVIGTLIVQGRARSLWRRSPLGESASVLGTPSGAAPAPARSLPDPVRPLGG